MGKYEAVIFDLDGTLVHTLPEHRYKIVGQTLSDLGVKQVKHHIDMFWFETRRDEIIKESFGLEPEQFWEIFGRYNTIELRKQFTKPYDDVDFVKELRQNGYKTGIVTGAPTHIASLEIGMIGEENFDSVIIAHGSNSIKAKPHPHGLEECLSLLETSKDKAIYVGNSAEDIETARNAQVFDILIARGEYEFPNLNPSLTIHSLYELRDFLA